MSFFVMVEGEIKELLCNKGSKMNFARNDNKFNSILVISKSIQCYGSRMT